MRRSDQVEELKRHDGKIWDIIVIGGGATGAGIALDAAIRGYKTLLLEQSDFSKGTSSRSTKLVHGGVRYLAQGDLLLVIEALKERGIMLRNAPHLCSNQEFVIPVYTLFDAALYTVGLKFYDILAGRLSLGKSYFISRKKVLERLPGLKADGLKGGVVYHDGQFDDARMNLDLVRLSFEKGATAINYFRVTAVAKENHGRINGVRAKDMLSGNEYDISARAVINATGVFANDIIKLDNPAAHSILRPSQGVHLVLDSSFLGSGSAIMIPKTDDGRVLFAIPWYGKVVVGTTDTPLDHIEPEPKALEEEISFILGTAGRYLTRAPGRRDVLSVFAGLRPLASDPDNPHSTKEISRRHKIIVSGSGLITITGGKWTTYRMMAAETINRAIKEGLIENRKCKTKGAVIGVPATEAIFPHFKTYGRNAADIETIIKEDPSEAELLHTGLPYTRAEIKWICRNEMVVTLEDVLARRTRALLLDARASIDIAPLVASIMAQEMGYGEDWKQYQINSYLDVASGYIL